MVTLSTALDQLGHRCLFGENSPYSLKRLTLK